MARFSPVVLALVAPLLAGGAQAAGFTGFTVCNQSPKDASVAVGFLDDTDGWMAQGWRTIARGACDDLLTGDLSGKAVYLLVDGGRLKPDAKQDGGWFCTDDDGFSTRNEDYADDQHQLMCEAAGLKLEQFREIPITGAEVIYTLR
jgi:uncharacterized membrane protein